MGPTLTILMLAQGLVVETPSPDALCPDLAHTRESVRSRLGEVQGAGYRAHYTIVHERGDHPKDFVKLELIDPAGDVRLRRELPIGNSCGAVADAIALVLERYFRTLVDGEVTTHAGGGLPGDGSAGSGVAAHQQATMAPNSEDGAIRSGGVSRAAVGSDAVVSEPQTGSAVVDTEPRASTAPGETAEARLALSLHGLVHSYALGPAAALRLEVPLDAWLTSSWSVALPFDAREESRDGPGGAVSARAAALDARWTLAWGRRIGAFRPFIGAGLHALGERGSAEGVEDSASHVRMAIGPCVEAGWRFDVGGGWLANVVGSVGWPLASSGRFMVNGDEMLELDDEIAFAGLGFGRSFSF